jgi:hypothetical protein
MVNSFLLLALLEVLSFKVCAFDKEVQKSHFYKKYLTYLKAKKYKIKDYRWHYTVIEDLDFVPEKASPGSSLYNSSIIWLSLVKESRKRVLGFRPIDTTTGCSSGCTPVVFHLVIDAKGNTVDIITEENKPLRKNWHVPFTANDLKKVKFLAKNLPKKLEYVKAPEELTYAKKVFPPQTWTFFKDVFISGGAYTSFAIYKAALLTKRYLNQGGMESLNKEYQEVLVVLRDIQKNHLSVLFTFSRIESLVQKYTNIKHRVLIFKWLLSYVGYLLKYDSLKEDEKLSSDDKHKYSIKALNKYSVIYLGGLQSSFVDFIDTLLEFKEGRAFILKMEKDFSAWKKLPLGTTKYTPILARVDKEATLAMDLKINNDAILEFCSDNNLKLIMVSQFFLKIANHNYYKKSIARINVRYPLIGLDGLDSIWKDSKEKKAYILQEEKLYDKVLLREFALSGKYIPKVKVSEYVNNSKKSQKKYLNLDGKNMVMYFSPSCPHCLELIRAAAERGSKNFWKKVQLVAVFVDASSMKYLDYFIEHSGLQKKSSDAYSGIVYMKNEDEDRKFYQEMGLFSVPKIVVINNKKEIINFNYELDTSEEKDFEAEFMRILSFY